MEKFKKNLINIKERIIKCFISVPKPMLGLIFAMLVLISPLLESEVTWGHDYNFHITNLFLNYKSINIFKFQLLLPKIFGGAIANGFGYGTGIFYPPLSYYLTSYIASILNYLNINIYLSLSILEILTIMLSGITMFIFLKRIFKDNNIASIGGISYISSTYFLCNIYIRCAIAEMLTFIFIPIIFLSLYELFFGKKKRFNLLFIIGYLGMIHSHLVLSIYLTIIILIIFLIFIKKVLEKDIIKRLIFSSIIILLLSGPYLVPLLEHKINGDYIVFSQEGMYTDYWIKENSISIHELFSTATKENNIQIYLNLFVLIASIISIIFNKQIFRNEKRNVYLITLILIIISLYISSSYFPWKNAPVFMKMIQFPWRLRGILSFGLSILAGNSIKMFKGINRQLLIVLLALAILFYGYNTINTSWLQYPTDIYSMNMGAQSEYLPTKTQDNYAQFLLRKNEIIANQGEAQIKILENNTPYLKSKIELTTDNVTLELPRIYYLGYEIKLTDKEGNVKKIDYYENDFGFIEIKLNKSGILEIDYKKTLANRISEYISLLTIGVLTILTIHKQKETKRKIKSNFDVN